MFDPALANRIGEAQFVSNMSNVYMSVSSSTRSKVEVKCHHKVDSCLRMAKPDSNLEKKFYRCPLWLVSGQNYGKIDCKNQSLGNIKVKLWQNEIENF